MTATLPFPAFASGLSWAMAENVLLKSDAEICGTVTLPPPELPPPELPPVEELPQAAATSAALAVSATSATFFVTCCKETTRFFVAG